MGFLFRPSHLLLFNFVFFRDVSKTAVFEHSLKNFKKHQKPGLLVGYARVSTFDQDPQMQIDALLEAGIDGRHLYEEHASGSSSNRPKLMEALEFVKEGDVLVVWKLD